LIISIRSTELKGVVIFHSGYGHTTRMAEAIAEGKSPKDESISEILNRLRRFAAAK